MVSKESIPAVGNYRSQTFTVMLLKKCWWGRCCGRWNERLPWEKSYIVTINNVGWCVIHRTLGLSAQWQFLLSDCESLEISSWFASFGWYALLQRWRATPLDLYHQFLTFTIIAHWMLPSPVYFHKKYCVLLVVPVLVLLLVTLGVMR